MKNTMSRIIVSVILAGLFAGCGPGLDEFMIMIEKHQAEGSFALADSLIENRLAHDGSLTEEQKKALLFELDRNERIINDYRLTEEGLFNALQRRLQKIDRDEFNRWQQEGRFDILYVNGEKRFANPSVSNLFFRYPELRARKKNRSTRSTQARLLWAHAQKLREISAASPDPVIFPRYCRVRQTLKLKRSVVPAGETVSCWLPYPSVFATQGNIRFIQSVPGPQWIAAPQSAIRSVYFEAPAGKDGELQFTLEYYYTAYAYFRHINPSRVLPFSGEEPEFRNYTREEHPHEVFTPEMRKLASDIVADESNVYLRGKRIYDWIANEIKYSYAREYSTLRNISEYCYSNGYGDCGQEAILFITLCRIAGVPARWQSGFLTFPGEEGMHDWAEIYVKPYGWLPVDPYMGIFFTSMTEDLEASQRESMKDFYFGNIDHFRLVANKGHNQVLYPPKKHFRSETVDFQRGEVEWSAGNLYFTEWRWSFEVRDEKAAGKASITNAQF